MSSQRATRVRGPGAPYGSFPGARITGRARVSREAGGGCRRAGSPFSHKALATRSTTLPTWQEIRRPHTPPRPRPLMLRPDSAPPPGLASPLLMACPPASSTPTLPHPTLTRTPTPHAGKTLGLRLGNRSAQAPPPPGSLPGPPPALGPEGGVLLVSHRARVHVALPQHLPPCLGQGSCVPVMGQWLAPRDPKRPQA